MRHPFSGLEPRFRRRLLGFLVVATAACLAGVVYADLQLRTPACPYGIVQLELARDPFPIHSILESWSVRPDMNLWAAFGLGLDFLFLFLYGALLSLGCAMVADRFGPTRAAARNLGVVLAWGQWIAAAADAVENVALLRILLRDDDPVLGVIASSFALLKFALLGAGIAYILAGLPLSRATAPEASPSA